MTAASRNIIIIFMMLLILPLNSMKAEDVIFEKYYVQDGLSDPSITAIYRDSQGFLWIGTSNGLNRFDGYSFTVFRSNSKNPCELEEEYIQSISEDKKHNLLVGTWNGGLAVFDRVKETFTHYVNDPNDDHSISNNWIRVIYQDKKGRIWLGTQNGLNLFDPEKKTFKRYLVNIHNPENPVELRLTSIYGIDEDNKGNLWIATWSGLVIFNPDLDRMIQIDKDHPSELISTNRLQSIVVNNNQVWIGTYKAGLILLKDIKISDEHLFATRRDYIVRGGSVDERISDLRINDLTEDNNGNLWIGTESGLNFFDISSGKIQQYFHKTEDSYSLTSNFITKTFLDEDGILWIGTLDNGLCKFDRSMQKFPLVFPEVNKSVDPLVKYVKAVYQDSKNRYWIGTDYGLFLFSPEMKLQKVFTHDPNDDESLDIGGVTGICEDSFGDYWVVTWGGGLHQLDESNWKFTRLPRQGNDPFEKRLYDDPFDSKNLGDADVRAFQPDYYGGIWMGTNSGFLDYYDIRKGKFQHYFMYDPDSLRGIPVSSLEMSSQGIIWGGSHESGGLIKVDPKTRRIDRFFAKNENNSLLSNDIYSLAIDDEDRIWIGTDIGLCLYIPEEDSFINYSEKVNLVEQAVYNIEIDNQGTLWLSTHSKLIHYNLEDNSKIEYLSQDGVRANHIIGITDNQGNIVVGGMNGINLFSPSDIPQNTKIPDLVFTEFRVFNEAVNFKDNKTPLESHVNYAKEIRLRHDQAFFSIGFASLNFSQTDKNQYMYKLEGVDKDWVAANDSRLANYTNISPGTYTFRVIGSNNDGVWNDAGRSLKIVIDPPWYKSWWAYSFYISLILVAIFIMVKVSIYREKLKNEIVMQRLEAKKHEEMMMKEREVDQMKLRFFTNISHEFRTPLTLIIGPAEELLREKVTAKSFENNLGIIKKNAHRLLRLVNQIMDFSKVESGFMKFNVKQGNVASYISGIIETFEHKALKRNINYSFTSTHKLVTGYFDSDKVEKILFNLISNAFKFTPDNGMINMSLRFYKDGRLLPPDENQPDKFEFSITDSGLGIPEEIQDQIFNRFFQGEKSNVGTGIGLSLAFALTKIHGGELTVSSQEGCGSTFNLKLPLALSLMNDYQVEEERVSPKENVSLREMAESENEETNEILTLPEEISNDIPRDTEKNIVLVIEDNQEMQQYIKGILEKDFVILTANDGNSGLKTAIKEIPDLIVSDVMMPGTDGYELCNNIKNRQDTSHIPVILLTAKSNNEDRLKGLEIGADDYIIKPFDAEELRLKINNIIATRAKFQARFNDSKERIVNITGFNSVDDKFLKDVYEILEENISESEFNHKILSEKVGMSRAQLYRKLKALTNQSVHEFIRLYRMEKALELLKDQGLTVSEVMYKVGFKNHSYFTKCFKEKYGTSPSDYQNTFV